jgi:hypothetical protein
MSRNTASGACAACRWRLAVVDDRHDIVPQ